MPVEVTVRHLNISDVLQKYAQEKADKLIEKFPAIEFVKIVLDMDGPFYTVGVAVQGGHRTTVESLHKDADMMAAINAAFDKAEAQLRKNAQRRHEVRP